MIDLFAVPDGVAELVLVRAKSLCEIDGKPLGANPFRFRREPKETATPRPSTYGAANILALCVACRIDIHELPLGAELRGVTLWQGEVPSERPVILRYDAASVYLSDDGSWSLHPAAAVTP